MELQVGGRYKAIYGQPIYTILDYDVRTGILLLLYDPRNGFSEGIVKDWATHFFNNVNLIT